MSTQRGKSKKGPTRGAGTAKKSAAAQEKALQEKSAAAEGTKISLPAFGFAEDLLKQRKPMAEEERASKGAAKTSARAPAVERTPRGEDRVFAFADRLEAGGEEEKQAPVRLETWVTFRLAGETFALPVEPVHEVVRPTSITRVPHAPYPIRGVTNLRGRVVPVIDLRLRLELPLSDVTRTSRIVVVGSRGRRLGLLVDAVRQVVHLDVDRVQPPPDDVMTVQSDYISGVYHLGEELILLLDVDRVLIIKEPVPATVDEAGNLEAGAA